MRYIIIEKSTPEELAAEVEEWLQMGFKLAGGVAVVSLNDDNYLYIQALVGG